MAKIRAVFSEHYKDHPDLVESLRQARALIDQGFDLAGGPLDRRQRKRRQKLNDLLKAAESLAPNASAGRASSAPELDPVLLLLLRMNYSALSEAGREDLARRELLDFAKGLTRREGGRPRTVDTEKLLEMKRLRDQGWSYGKIAKKVGSTAQDVRLILAYHYPREKPR